MILERGLPTWVHILPEQGDESKWYLSMLPVLCPIFEKFLPVLNTCEEYNSIFSDFYNIQFPCK